MRSRETVTYSLVFLLILSIFSGIYGPEKVLELDEKNDVKMIDPKFIQNHSQEVPGPSGHQKTLKNNAKHPPEPLRGVQKK